MLELTPQEVEILYQILDQVNVRGSQQKRIVVAIMEKLEAIARKPDEASADD